MLLKFSALLGLAEMQYLMTNLKDHAKTFLKNINDQLKVAHK